MRISEQTVDAILGESFPAIKKDEPNIRPTWEHEIDDLAQLTSVTNMHIDYRPEELRLVV